MKRETCETLVRVIGIQEEIIKKQESLLEQEIVLGQLNRGKIELLELRLLEATRVVDTTDT